MSEESDDKQHEPSQKRLDDARKRGEIPKSNELIAASVLLGFLISIAGFGTGILSSFGSFGRAFLDQPDKMADLIFENSTPTSLGIIAEIGKLAAPVFLLPTFAALAMIIAQRAIVFAPEKIAFKASRISIVSNAAQKFGPAGLFEFSKSFAKLILISTVLGIALSRHGSEILQSMSIAPAQGITLTLEIMFEFLSLVLLMQIGFGGIDYLWQNHQHRKKNRMSRKELMDESKDAEGDPQLKQFRRQMGQDITSSQNIQDVASADVVIVNPTHYAVALKWDRKSATAPVCVAKGVDEIAARIREKAAESGVPLHSDPPTARAIFATVDVGQQIKSEHFRAVAAAIRFSEKMRRRRREMYHGK